MLASYKLSGKYIFISGFLFTSVLGTLSHFFYEWSGDSTFIGLVCPISESAWEHMKLLFFPALLYCFLLCTLRVFLTQLLFLIVPYLHSCYFSSSSSISSTYFGSIKAPL